MGPFQYGNCPIMASEGLFNIAHSISIALQGQSSRCRGARRLISQGQGGREIISARNYGQERSYGKYPQCEH
jgi:hypothetical protein